jgi:hypothetical protein
MVEFKVKKFDISKMKSDAVIVLLGKRRTGKSYLVRDLLYNKRHDVPIGTVISRTDHMGHFYDQFIPPLLIHKRYTAELLKKVLKRQQMAIEEQWNKKNAFLLMDDCLADAKDWKNDEMIKEIFFNGRWYKLLLILTMQSPMGIPPDFRTNIDYTFILKNNNAADREKIYKNYAGIFETKEMFNKVLDACTEDYNALVIDNTTHSNNISDQVFFYKAESHENFKMCSPKLWEKCVDKTVIKPSNYKIIK